MEIQHEIQDKKYNFLKEELTTVRQCKRLCMLRLIFTQSALLYLLDLNFLMKIPSINRNRDYILNSN